MSETDSSPLPRRGFAGRLGISALNLIAPGLGLLRIGELRWALLLLIAPFAFLALLAIGMRYFPITGYGTAMLAMIVLVGLLISLYLVPVALTWHRSRLRVARHWWSRWYALIVVAVAFLVLMVLANGLVQAVCKPFNVPSTSMEPTLEIGDKFIADMRWNGPPQRGEIILFDESQGVRVNRIVAIAGDRVALRAGVPVVNGTPAEQVAQGEVSISDYGGPGTATLLDERLPGEAGVHQVLDAEATSLDTMQEVVVPADHIFVLGDHRDRSADSRVAPEMGGVGMVPVSAIIGRPISIYWSTDHSRIGTRFDG